MRRLSTYLLLLILLVPLGGCYDKQDIEQRTTILAIAIDKNPAEDEGLEITVQIATHHNIGDPAEGGGGGGKPILVTTIRGKSIGSIFQELENMVNNPLFFGNTMLLAIGKEVATEGIYPYLDYFIRNPQFRRQAWLVVTPGQAKEILEIEASLHPIPAFYLRSTLDNLVDIRSIPFTMFENFIINLHCTAKQPVAVMLAAAGDKVELKGLAAFANDKMVGELDPAELRLLLNLTQTSGRGLVHLLDPQDNIELSYEIHNSSSQIEANLEEGQISFTYKLWLEGDIVENPLIIPLESEDTLQQIEQRLAAKLESEYQRIIYKIQQEIGSDTLNVGEYVRAKFPHYWKQIDWEEEFPQVPIKVEVTTRIRRLGIKRG